MANIDIIQPENATGELKEIYDDLLESRGKIAEVHKIQSLNPKSILNHMDLYMTIMFGQSPLRRVHREMLAVVVSKANDCEYCQIHHTEAVKNFWKDSNKTDQLRLNYEKADLTIEEMALCDYAWNLTKYPGNCGKEKYSDQLQKIGFSDRAILDATLVVSYFNFVNRMVLSLGVELEEHPGGYKYD